MKIVHFAVIFHILSVCCCELEPVPQKIKVKDFRGGFADDSTYEIESCFYKVKDITHCCDDYEYDKSQNVCLPKCENGCGSGRCIAKNKCSCDFGYKWDKSLEKCSLMDCDKECVSPKGKCVHPGKCECNKGYTQSSNKTCIPYCESGCDHGFCVQPNKCRCSAGFKEKNLNGTSVCEPYCDPPCKNSKCVRPNVCECDKGFTKDDRKKNECHCGLHCQEIDMECKCLTEDSRVGGDLIEHDISSLQTVENGTTLSHCLNGFTLNNGTCVCAIGYIMRRNYTDLCEPLCDPECDENGFCDRPNECKCKDGYKLGENEGEGNRCYPECENGFENEINGNFACSASALISEPQTAKSNWILPVVGLVIIVVAAIPIALLIFRKRKMRSSGLTVRDVELPTFDIEVYPMEDF